MNYSAITDYLEKCRLELPKHSLPGWEQLPSIELYMDQVIEVVNSYVSGIDGAQAVTRPMINNYVKLKMMPAPQKKKYGRIHLAYIIVICTLKQGLNISAIQKILPNDIPDEEVRRIYSAFTVNHRKAFEYVLAQAEKIALPVISDEKSNPQNVDDLIMQIASSANILKSFTDKAFEIRKSE